MKTDDIKCENCIVNIKAGELSINDSEIMKYDKDKDEFVAVTGKEIDYNYVSDPIIRFYPKDQYGNSIDNIGTDSYTASITKDGASVADLIKNAEHQDNSYVEFVKKDNNYNSLSGGEYILTITDSKGNKKSTTITLAGNPDSEYYKNQELDLSKTYLIDSNLKFQAGDSGYFIIELRTKNNLKYTTSLTNEIYSSIKVQSCNVGDTSFNYQVLSPTPNFMIYIKVTTQLSNNYPTNQKCPLSFSISSSSINVAPLMEVSPSSLRSAVIPNSYLKVAEGNELKDTNADISLKFEVVGYDKFKNVNH